TATTHTEDGEPEVNTQAIILRDDGTRPYGHAQDRPRERGRVLHLYESHRLLHLSEVVVDERPLVCDTLPLLLGQKGDRALLLLGLLRLFAQWHSDFGILNMGLRISDETVNERQAPIPCEVLRHGRVPHDAQGVQRLNSRLSQAPNKRQNVLLDTGRTRDERVRDRRRNLCQVILREVLAQVDGVAVLANPALQRLLELVLVKFRVSGVRTLSVESQLFDEVEKLRNAAVAFCTQPDCTVLFLHNVRVAEVVTLRLEQLPNAIHLLAHSGGRLSGLQGGIPFLDCSIERGDRARLLLIEKPMRGRCDLFPVRDSPGPVNPRGSGA